MPRLFSRRPLALVVAIGTAFLGAVSLNAGSATASTNPHALTAAQVQAYSAGPARAVIVELADQHHNLGARSDMRARASAAAADQAGFLQELAAVHATKVKSFALVNAFAATVPAAEAAHLASEAGVAAVVPDLPIKAAPLPDATERADTTKFKAAPTSPTTLCPSNPKKPLLEPEALQLTNTAFNDPNTPQAQNLVDGTGVKVAFIADGVDPNNPDFIRANGQHVFVDYQDFSGDGLKAPTSGAEAFGDASAIAAQGRKSYDLSTFANPAHPIPAGCTIRVLGMAPGAQLVGLKAFGAESAPTSNILQAINYAVTNDNVDVINESFGGNPYPDNNTDPISLADEAAVAAGVVVVSSTGDSGTTNTLGSPATDPTVISAGATTMFRSYAQLTAYGFGLSKGTFASNNISSLSSGGVSQNARTQDVSAPGDLGWALCSKKPIYEGCTDDKGAPSGIQDFGGTSQSSPLTAGEAALVIEAYKNAHSGAHPTPALVKQIITSTATDLNHPSYEQGAGLIDSLAAVQAAMSAGNATKTGSTLLTSPNQISAIAAPGASNAYPVTVTNNGAQTQTLHASGRIQGPAITDVTGQVTLDTTSPSTPFYVDQFGSQRFYVLKHFTVPAGVDRLDASVAAHQSFRMSPIRMILIDSLGTYQAYTIPQGNGNFGHIDVHSPVAGTWTAVIAAGGAGGFDGPVSFEFATSNYTGFGSVTPSSQTVAPGASATFNVALATPANPGDTSASLQISNGVGQVQSIPITLRSLLSTNAAGGAFTGVFTGGNGRGFPGQSVAYQFDVPSGQHDFGINLRLTNRHQQVIGFVVSPEGTVVSSMSNVTIAPDGTQVFGNTLQMFVHDPAAGRWELAFAITNPIFGNETSDTYSGALAYNVVSVKATGLPTSAATTVSAKAPLTAKIKVTNTGTQTQTFFVDPRTTTTQALTVLPITPATGIALPIPPTAAVPRWIVPTDSTSLSLLASATLPVQADLQYSGGNPEVVGPPGDASTATVSASEVAPGLWSGFAGEVGPYSPSAPAGTVDFTTTATTLGFDRAVKSSTGDLWLQTVDASAPGVKFLTLAPGETGTIKVTITPGATASAVVHGTIFVDDFNFFTDQGDELVALPYTYTVG
jgi:subtilisin family serine protease